MTTTSTLHCPPRFATPRNPERATLGPAVGEVARRLNKPLMPWQQLAADIILEIDPETGGLYYGEFDLTVPRQSGKSTFVLAKATHRCSATGFFGRRQRVVYTAQTRLKAREKWEEDYASALDESATFKSRVRTLKGAGAEHIRFENGSRFGIDANTESAGHGGTLDEAYIDEAFAQKDARLEQAFRPAMITRPNTQLGIISTAGWLDLAPFLWNKIQRGRAAVEEGRPTRVAYLEWSAPDDADPADPETWRACMPALGYTITEASIRAEFDGMDLPDFRRAYLNQWVPKPILKDDDDVYPLSAWNSLADYDGADQNLSRVVLSVDIPPDRSTTAIAAAGIRADGYPQLEIVDYQPGTRWAVQRIVDVAQRRGIRDVVLDGSGSAFSLKQALEDAGLLVRVTTARDMAAACSDLFDAIVETRELRHVPHDAVTAAIVGARKRNLSDAWGLDRRRADADISPLVATVLAHWLVTRERAPLADADLLQTFH